MWESKKGRIALLLIVVLAIACSFCSCKTKSIALNDVVNDTLIVSTHDTIKVHDRVVDVQVPLPIVKLQNATKDSTSILTNGYCTSIAKLRNGILYHSLLTLPGAKVSGQVNVKDTTITHYSDKQHSVDRQHNTIKYVKVKQPLSTWKKVIMFLGYIMFTIILVAVVGFAYYMGKKFSVLSIIKKLIILLVLCSFVSCKTTSITQSYTDKYKMEYTKGYISEDKYNFLLNGLADMQEMKSMK